MQNRCDMCGERTECRQVTYRKVTGMLVVFTYQKQSTAACRRCSMKMCQGAIVHCAALGWWGYISFFVNLYCLIANAIEGISTLLMRSDAASMAAAFAGEADYARALLDGKPFDVVVEVMQEKTGVSPEQVAVFLRALS